MKYLWLVFLVVCSIESIAQSQLTGNPGLTPPKADTLFINQRWAEAIPLYEQAVLAGFTAPLNNFRLGYARQKTGNYTTAKKDYQVVLSKNPPIPLLRMTLVNLAKLSSLSGQLDSCKFYLRLAMDQGYSNLQDLEQSPEFILLRADKLFPEIHDSISFRAYPCKQLTEARWFDFWVGEWEVYVTGTSNLAGHSKIEKIAGDCAILENWTSTAGNFNGKSINFYNSQTLKWEQHWVGSAGGYQKFEHGEYKDSAMHFSFTRTNNNGTEAKGRFTFYNQGSNQVRQFSESSTDQGKTWTVDYDFTYTRKSGAGE